MDSVVFIIRNTITYSPETLLKMVDILTHPPGPLP